MKNQLFVFVFLLFLFGCKKAADPIPSYVGVWEARWTRPASQAIAGGIARFEVAIVTNRERIIMVEIIQDGGAYSCTGNDPEGGFATIDGSKLVINLRTTAGCLFKASGSFIDAETFRGEFYLAQTETLNFKKRK